MKSEIINDLLSYTTPGTKDEVLFSVIIPTYNRGEKIKICLDSLVNQSYKSFEVIVCDDGSTDNTKTIVTSYEDKLDIKYIWEENWGGPARPRNNGIKLAQGKWICFLDSDDWWYSNKLEIVYQYILNFPVIDVICHDLILNDLILGKKYLLPCGPVVPNLYRDLLTHGNRFPNSAISIKKSTLDQHKIKINESKDFISVEDYDLSLLLAACKASFGCISITLGEYIIETNNISSTNIHLKNLEFLLRKHVFEIQTFESNKSLLWNEVCSRLNTIKGTESYRQSRYLDSLKYFFIGLKLSRSSFLKYISDRLKLSLKRIRTSKAISNSNDINKN